MTTNAIACPRPPEPPARSSFPLFASVAPVLASVAIWAVTQSPFALAFALLGPVVAVAGLADARRHGRRRMREERSRFDRELAAAGRAIDEAHERERSALRRQAPAAAELLATAHRDPERWRGRLDEEVLVTLGTGRSESGLALDRPAAVPSGPAGRALDGLRSRAAVLEDAPILVDARLGIGLCGPDAKASSVAGAILVQLASALSPDAVALCQDGPLPRGLHWVTDLPHSAQQYSAQQHSAQQDLASGPTGGAFEFRPKEGAGSRLLVAVAEEERGLPRDCRVIVRFDGAGPARILRHPDGRRAEFSPGFVSAREGALFASILALAAGGSPSRDGAGRRPLPSRVDFSALRQPGRGDGASLAACLGAGEDGPVTVDLVGDGPHAVVGGTTGSGKSELLVTWVLAIASAHSPETVTFLLVDFKGGAAFAPLRGLPHVVGTVTDLDETAATRALESLRAELRHRETFLAERGARSIEELRPGGEAGLARLVIVVDEFATLVSGFPELHELFADLAARGRSLGVHLILCTQRPAGSVRDAVLANCALRLSLRVNDRADSVAVLGAPDAAELPRHPAGRAVVSRGEGSAIVQLAIAGEADAAAVALRWRPARPVRRPWLDPLPARLLPEDLPPGAGTGLVFGLVDRPDRQSRESAVYDPATHGHLLVVGGRGSGKSGALAAIAAAGRQARWVPASVEGAWDLVTGTLERVRSGHPASGLLLLDDAGTLFGRLPPDHRAAFLDTVAALHREGPAAGVHLVSSSATAIAPLSGLCETRLVLRMPDRHEHAAALGSSRGFDPALPPGGGTWNGFRTQVVLVPRPEPQEPPGATDLAGLRLPRLVVVAGSPSAVAGRLGALGRVTTLADPAAPAGIAAADPGGEVILGDPDAWNAAWGVLGTLRGRLPVLFHSCSVAEYRALSRRRELPPPIAAPADTGWLLHPDGRVERVRLPDGGRD